MMMVINIPSRYMMLKTIQMTIDEMLLERVDSVVETLATTRSAFIREAVERALEDHHWRELERLDEEGYRQFPPDDSEVEIWLGVQEWGDEWNAVK